MDGLPSQLYGRNTYVTRGKQGADAVGLPTIAAGFEQAARVSQRSCLIPWVSVIVHENIQAPVYLLLFDLPPKLTAAQGTSEPSGSAEIVAGDLALITIGPTTGVGQVLIFDPLHSEAHIPIGHQIRMLQTGETRGDEHIGGFPFDSGCVAALSTTGGRLTLLAQNAEGGRFTARIQSCG